MTMTRRKIVQIDEQKCDGCGLCVPACAEGAIQIIEGKAKIVNERYCDGLGACLGECPRGAITVEEREAVAYNQAAVEKHLALLKQKFVPLQTLSAGCPGSTARQFKAPSTAAAEKSSLAGVSRLSHWPVQLKLVPPQAPFLKNADILFCADCVPFAVPDFHERYLAGRAVLVGCPKLDDLNYYYEKLKVLFAEASPGKITVLKMEVPCCSGIARAVIKARHEVCEQVPVDIYTIGIQGGCRRESIPSKLSAEEFSIDDGKRL